MESLDEKIASAFAYLSSLSLLPNRHMLRATESVDADRVHVSSPPSEDRQSTIMRDIGIFALS